VALLDSSKCQCNVGQATVIFARYGDFIRAVIHSQVRNEAQADDMFQDFFPYF